jgi:molybdopterin-binding protein
MSEVIVETSSGEVASIVTTRSVEEMKLKVGDEVYVLVKATSVALRRRD